MKVRIPLSFSLDLYRLSLILLRLVDPLLSPDLIAGRLTGLSRWADHANLVSGVSMRDLAAGELRQTSADVTHDTIYIF